MTTKSINFSKLFSKLLKEHNEIDDTVSSFLYYMFPRDLFIRALSLIESNNMFIYALAAECCQVSALTTTFHDTPVSSTISKSVTSEITEIDVNIPQMSSPISQVNKLIEKFMQDDIDLSYRLIVRPENTQSSPLYVDLDNWTCSCTEFSELFQKELETSRNSANTDLKDLLIREIDDMNDFSEDKFAQLDSHSLSKQRYFKWERITCCHLLAYSIVLKSSPKLLRYFIVEKTNVLLIPINNIDEWLKLHINIVE
ncbi:hypothetical protein KAFR_0C02530 [Kazachstania africana CBS 2517]|uniref:Suppressor of hydroxyurea sensitivity protein 2 n=1 Tax=Kazachstania africana (strain ATCC 22294 / BCRC 22015 / CBS 2517 / CECT 1963 / NBRC 1671 / NRRL Y-8276) TaxID=1071382 RepID=H2AS96_KAZAF|nr:hypothetical protein KAFR_0C02530 [Kazachstania africana CBS 2517]CCF57246.1 hypothetical protein KAFR_0C02530 [Kazachstania africana CBS 2517]